MVCIINGSDSLCIYEGYAHNESFLDKIETDEYNNTIGLVMSAHGPITAWVNINGQPVHETAPGSANIIYESALPRGEAILLFFYNYWYLIALIILGITLVAAL